MSRMTRVTYCGMSPDSTIEYFCTLGNRGLAASRSRRLFSWSCVSCEKSSPEMIGRPLWDIRLIFSKPDIEDPGGITFVKVIFYTSLF